jgi:hypothetical protein
MAMIKKLNYSFWVLLAFALSSVKAQELNCQVTVNFSKIGGADQQFYQSMENTIREFMNTRKWTSDVFQVQERITSSITIMLDERVSTNVFKATVQIQSSRPVFFFFLIRDTIQCY